MKCPGQDTQFWVGDLAFDVPCPKCGSPVEVFKDERSVRCPKCKFRFDNPRMDLGCAKWCPAARECLGLAGAQTQPANVGEGALASRLITALRDASAPAPDRPSRALVAFQHARELSKCEGGDPRIVLAATLVLEWEGVGTGPAQAGQPDRAAIEARTLCEAGLDKVTAQRTMAIVSACRGHVALDCVEFRIVGDAVRLAALAEDTASVDESRLAELVDTQLRTAAGKERARKMFAADP